MGVVNKLKEAIALREIEEKQAEMAAGEGKIEE